MHTSDLNWISQNVAEFGGAIPSDAILHTVRNRFYIVNTEPSHLPGSHWVCIYNGKVPEFFDSLGKDPSFYDKTFEYHMINMGPSYMHNTLRVQDRDSESCGLFCVYYLIHRTRGWTMTEIMNSFNIEDKNANEKKVSDFVACYLENVDLRKN